MDDLVALLEVNLHMNYLCLLSPFVSLWILDEWIGICDRQVGIIVQRLKLMLLVASCPYFMYNAYYCFLYGIRASVEGRAHLVALMFIVLVVIMVVSDYRGDINEKLGVQLLYYGAALNCTMLVLGQESAERDMSFLFKVGGGSYLVGLLLVAANYH